MSDATTASDLSESEPRHNSRPRHKPELVHEPIHRPGHQARRLSAAAIRGHTETSDGEIVPLFSDIESPKKQKQAKRKRALGRKPRRRTLRAPRSDDDQAHETSDSEAEIEALIPDHIKKRRAAFERRQEIFREAGLRLPPKFENIDFSDDEDLSELQERPDFPTATPIREYKDVVLERSLGVVPASIAQWLRDYQVAGAKFLHTKFVYQEGAILGDDMGLGKTIQIITFLTAAFGKTGDERDLKRMRKLQRAAAAAKMPTWYPRVLIVCPGTLIENWKTELNRWGWWHVDVYHGPNKDPALDTARSGRTEIMITTYTTYREHKDQVNEVAWDAVIADECHTIKGRKSETTKAMNEINALCRIGLTGTAIQNTYDELWTLLNWTSPGKLDTAKNWREFISDPLRLGQSHEATMHQLAKSRKLAHDLAHNLLPKFFLRRMKTLIAHQLPKKTDRVVFCGLTETQEAAYERFVSSENVELIKTSTDKCDCLSGKQGAKRGWCCYKYNSSGVWWQALVFPCIMNLQKMANHLALLIPQDQDPREKQEKDLMLMQDAFPERWKDLFASRGSIIHYADPQFCGKWRVLKKLLKFWFDTGDKVLVFSHSVRLLRMLRLLFQSTSYNVSYLDGSMSLEDRAREVDVFNADPDQFVFLISTKAGGVGLNITAANKVVIFDPNWNPAYDLQAQDRAYRIGQTRDVEVFRLISSGTVEEIVYARQIYKQQQANIGYTASNERRYFKGIQENKHQKGEIFGLKNLFAYQGENIVLREIVNKTNVAESKAGVSIADVNLSQIEAEGDPLFSSQSDDEESAMSQLAKMVTKGETDLASAAAAAGRKKRTAKSDPVQAILAQAGVEYTHENSEVIGSSRVEERISKKALDGGNSVSQTRKHAFGDSRKSAGRRAVGDGSSGAESDGLRKIAWRFNPPEDVKRRQFCTMAKTFGFPSAEEFALVVEGWTQAQRRNCLDRFYAIRREQLGINNVKAPEAASDAEMETEP